MPDRERLLRHTAAIVGSFVERNRIAMSELPALIESVDRALRDAAGPAPTMTEAASRATPAQIMRSIRPEALVSFEDGRSYKLLKRHLRAVGLTPDEYRAKWGLPSDYPMVAPAYSTVRSAFAKDLGLGTTTRSRARKG